jgi:hypothetical protein
LATAARNSLPSNERKKYHYLIARHLMGSNNNTISSSELTPVLSHHFHEGIELVKDSAEKGDIAKLYLQEGLRLVSILRIDLAKSMFENAITLIESITNYISVHTDLYISLNLELVRIFLQRTNFVAAEKLLDSLKQKAPSGYSIINISLLYAHLYMLQGRFSSLLALSISELSKLNFNIPDSLETQKEYVQANTSIFIAMVKNKSAQEIADYKSSVSIDSVVKENVQILLNLMRCASVQLQSMWLVAVSSLMVLLLFYILILFINIASVGMYSCSH